MMPKTLFHYKMFKESSSLRMLHFDINNKINDTNKQLYSGRTTNPKELSNLQAEVKWRHRAARVSKRWFVLQSRR